MFKFRLCWNLSVFFQDYKAHRFTLLNDLVRLYNNVINIVKSLTVWSISLNCLKMAFLLRVLNQLHEYLLMTNL